MKNIIIVVILTGVVVSFFLTNPSQLDPQETEPSIVENKLKEMTLEEKIAQILLVRVPSNNAKKIIQENQFGGLVFYASDFKDLTKEEVIRKITTYQSLAKIPLLTAVDEEGGKVVRISSNPNLRETPFLSSRELYQQGGLDKIREDTIEKSALLESLGINLNLAPVVDISTDENDYMYSRSIGESKSITAKYAQTVIEASKNSKVSYTLKHFPGYGNNVDTHQTQATDSRSLESIKENDLFPFQKGIEAGAEAILVSHNIVTAIDSQNPASLSEPIHKLLRDDLSFKGIIITDDISMGATKEIDQAFTKAILCGNDLIIVTDYEKAIEEGKEAIANGRIPLERIDEMVRHILTWKHQKGLL